MIEILEPRRLFSAYLLTLLGTAHDYSTSAPTGINDYGQICGTVSGGPLDYSAAAVYSDGTWNTLPGSFRFGNATAINNQGQVIGSNEGQAFLYSNGNSISLQGATSLGGGELVGTNFTFPEGINNNGDAVGSGVDILGTKTTDVGALYHNGAITDLTGLTTANGINDQSVVVGSNEFSQHAILLNGSTATDLGTLGGPTSTAGAINNDGQIVGDADTAAGNSHAFLYAAGKMIDLGTLGGATSSEDGINASGVVVGTSDMPKGLAHAFIYNDGVMRDLTKLIPTTPGWTFTEATAINSEGQIVGNETNAKGQTRGVLLTPAAGTDQLRTHVTGVPALPLAIGTSGYLSVRLTNDLGHAVSGKLQITVYASTSNTISAGDASIVTASVNVGNFSFGQSKSFRLKYTIPQTLVAGKYQLLAGIAGVNPVLSFPAPAMVSAHFVDLSVDFTGVIQRRVTNLVVSVEVKSIGTDLAAGTVSANLYSSNALNNGVLTPDAVLLTSVTSVKVSLAPGRRHVLRFSFKRAAVPTIQGDFIVVLTPSATINDADAADNMTFEGYALA